MKNNIIIAGVPRAGKSTISHILSKRYGYQHVSMDSIIAGFEKCFPETGVSTYQGLSSMETLRVISGKMAPFIRAMLDSAEYDEFEPGMVLDMYQLLPEDFDKYLRGANCEIFYFITSDVTAEERFAIQKKYDTPKDYTFYKSDEELKEGAQYIVEQSLLIKEQCEKFGLKYYETARNREDVFEQFFKDLRKLKEEKIIYRKAELRDCHKLAELKGQVWKTTYRGIYTDEALDNYDVEKNTQIFEQICNNPDIELYLAESENEPVGLMTCGKPYKPIEGFFQEIGLLYIHKNFQCKGIGKNLIQLAKEQVRKNGFDRFVISVNRQNENAIAFYKKMGGIEIAEDQNQKRFCFSV